MNDFHSAIRLIFTNVMPTLRPPPELETRESYLCGACDDRFLFQYNYIGHLNRKTLKIIFFCERCNENIIFYNRCSFILHIKSHEEEIYITIDNLRVDLVITDKELNFPFRENTQACTECYENIYRTGNLLKDRKLHYTRYSRTFQVCPVCLFILPNMCALVAHLRIHLKILPYFCPECGKSLSHSNILYPYDHDCQGFKKMKSNIKLFCNVRTCDILLPPHENEIHLKGHFRKVYKCTHCAKARYNNEFNICPECHNMNSIIYFQSPCRPNILYKEPCVDAYISSQVNIKMDKQVYPCQTCYIIHKDVKSLLLHHITRHNATHLNTVIEQFFIVPASAKTWSIHNYFVIKTCNKCSKCFKFRYTNLNINKVQVPCPFGCLASDE